MALKHNKILLSCIMALGVAIIFTALSLCNVLELWQNRLSDNLYKNHISPSNDIVIVGIDDKTISALNSFGMPCCWDRSIYAKVISNLGKYDPKIIAIDSIFAGERTKEGDQQFAGSFKQAKTVILAYLDSPIIDNTKNSFTRAPNSSVSKPYSALTDQSNVSLAFVNIPVEKNDVTIRRYVTSITDQATGEEHDSFALAIVRSFLGNEETNMILKNIPFEKGMLINYLSKSDVDSG
jgi:CHASE2 domain-containing sensor protein